MLCPFCGAEDTQVKDSRQSLDGRSVKRRRVCLKCNSRFNTYEKIEIRELTVIKKDGSRRPFDQQKIFNSINLAVRKRLIPLDRIELLVDNIVKKIEKSGEAEITSGKIGEMIMEELAKLDDVAYVRFASVYHDFSEIRDFENFLNKIDKNKL